MKFSVLIPVYNTEKYVEECVKSVLAQTETDFEIILADDGSTDSSGRICDNLALIDKRIKVYHKENERLMMTRRFEIRKAQGDYILFLDSDDYWDKSLLERVWSTIVKYSADMVIYNYYRVTNGRKVKNTAVFSNETLIDENNKKEFLIEAVGRNRLNSMWIKAVRRDLVLGDTTDYRKYQDAVVSGEDIFQSIPLFFLARRIVYLDEPLVFYRELPTSITATYNSKKFDMVQIEYNRKKEYLMKYNFFDEKMALEISNTAYKKIVHLMFNNVANSKLTFKQKVNVLQQYRIDEFSKHVASRSFELDLNRVEKTFGNLWRWKCNSLALALATMYQKLRRLRT